MSFREPTAYCKLSTTGSLLASLPNELLENILFRTMPDVENFIRPQSVKSRDTPRLFTSPILQTCRKIRQIGLEMISRRFTWISFSVPTWYFPKTQTLVSARILGSVSEIPSEFQSLLRDDAVKVRIVLAAKDVSSTDTQTAIFLYNYSALLYMMQELSIVKQHRGLCAKFTFDCTVAGSQSAYALIFSPLCIVHGMVARGKKVNINLQFNGTPIDQNTFPGLLTSGIQTLKNMRDFTLTTLRFADELENLGCPDEAGALLITATFIFAWVWSILPEPHEWAFGEEPSDYNVVFAYVVGRLRPGQNSEGNHVKRLLFRLFIRALRAYVRFFDGDDIEWCLEQTWTVIDDDHPPLNGPAWSWFGLSMKELSEWRYNMATFYEAIGRYMNNHPRMALIYAPRIKPDERKRLKPGSDGIELDYLLAAASELYWAMIWDPENEAIHAQYETCRGLLDRKTVQEMENLQLQRLVFFQDQNNATGSRKIVWGGNIDVVGLWGGERVFQHLSLASKGLDISPTVDEWLKSLSRLEPILGSAFREKIQKARDDHGI